MGKFDKDLKKAQKVESLTRADLQAVLEIFYNSPKISVAADNGATEMSGAEFKLLLQRKVAFLLEDTSAYGVRLV